MSLPVKIHPSALVDQGAVIGDGTAIWHFSHICSGAVIGKNCSIGQNVMVADKATLGNGVKIQNNVAIYGGVTVENDVFLDHRVFLPMLPIHAHRLVGKPLYENLIRRGATVGANATIVCGITLGRYSFIGAGAVVTKDVPDYGLVLGNPANMRFHEPPRSQVVLW